MTSPDKGKIPFPVKLFFYAILLLMLLPVVGMVSETIPVYQLWLVALLIGSLPFIWRKLRPGTSQGRYPFGRIMLLLIVALASMYKAPPHVPTVEEEANANYARLAEEERQKRELENAKKPKAVLEAEEAQSEICQLVLANMDHPRECTAKLYKGKVTLLIKYDFHESLGFKNDERLLGFHLMKALSAVYNSKYRFHRTKILALADLTDAYGHTSNGVFANIVLDEPQAYKLNWKMDEVLLPDYLPHVWKVTGPITHQ